MAIRIKNIRVNGKRVRNLDQVKVAKQIEACLSRLEGVDADVEVSRYYTYRWYSISDVTRLIEEEIAESLKALGKQKRKAEEEMKDIREMYQKKAEEIALEKYGKEFGELNGLEQYVVYMKAEELVGEEMQEAADLRRKEERVNGNE